MRLLNLFMLYIEYCLVLKFYFAKKLKNIYFYVKKISKNNSYRDISIQCYS